MGWAGSQPNPAFFLSQRSSSPTPTPPARKALRSKLLAPPCSGTGTGTIAARSSSYRGLGSAGSCVGGGGGSLDVLGQHLGRVLRSKAFRVHRLSQGGDVIVLRGHLA